MKSPMAWILLLPLLGHWATATPVIKAPWGTLSGVRIEGQGGKVMDGYLGVPFALPPIGNLRWQKPVPHPGPEAGQVFAADTLQPACQQETPTMLVYGEMSEDCLTLNVFVPVEDNQSQTSPRAVMVFIHGGGFYVGDAPTYRPTQLVADGGVVVVTIHYRLGVLGFLSTGDDTLPGNYGMWDQQLALKWVKDNIRAFGGDPDAITIFGESAGSMSVGLQILTPESKGLFRRAILQSGSPTFLGKNEWVKDAKTSFDGLAATLKCQSDSKVKALQCLRRLSAEELVDNPFAYFLKMTENKNPYVIAFGPRVDGDFLPRDPMDLLQDADYMKDRGINDMDVLTGFDNNEGGVFGFMQAMMGGQPGDKVPRSAFLLMMQSAVGVSTKSQPNEMLEKVVEFFYRGADAGSENLIPAATLAELYGDFLFFAPSVNWMRTLVAQPHDGNRYMYVFDHDFAFNRNSAFPGTHHGDELPVEFEMLGLNTMAMFQMLNKSYDTEDIPAISSMFVQLLTTFAKTGKPSGPVEKLLKEEWPEFTAENENYVALSLAPEVRKDVFRDRVALWLNLVPALLKETSSESTSQRAPAKEEL